MSTLNKMQENAIGSSTIAGGIVKSLCIPNEILNFVQTLIVYPNIIALMIRSAISSFFLSYRCSIWRNEPFLYKNIKTGKIVYETFDEWQPIYLRTLNSSWAWGRHKCLEAWQFNTLYFRFIVIQTTNTLYFMLEIFIATEILPCCHHGLCIDWKEQ